jgi:hypothetical protein
VITFVHSFHKGRQKAFTVPLPVVRHFYKNDVMNSATHFVVCGYMEGNGVFYVALENNKGKTMDVIPYIRAS